MSGIPERLIVFTRYPAPGRAKTRLIPALGPEGAAALQRRLTLRALRLAETVRARRDVAIEIRYDGAGEAAVKHWLGNGPGRIFRPQGSGDLGERLARAFEDSFREAGCATIIIGADCPGLTPELLETAFDTLSAHPAVLGPATDGGYYLIGLRRAVPGLFRGLAWGTETVLADTLQILQRANLEPVLMERRDDIDRPEDLPLWHRIAAAEDTGSSRLSIIIPALNEAGHIAATVTAAREGKPHEILVVDGGSSDDTVRLARAAGAAVILSRPGRAGQMNAGGARATGNGLLFLHADTLLPPGYAGAIAEALGQPRVAAGAFRFRILEDFRGKWIVEWTTHLRSRWRQMPYGDQGLFLRRAVFEELGGFADLPIMEDYDLVRRLRRRGRVITVNREVRTSGRRWLRLGFIRATLINKWVIAGYHLGWPKVKLAAIYKQPPQRSQKRTR